MANLKITSKINGRKSNFEAMIKNALLEYGDERIKKELQFMFTLPNGSKKRKKLHTIVLGLNTGWHDGKTIHLIDEKGKMFAPPVKAICVQKIIITYQNRLLKVRIDGHYIIKNQIEELARNEGFKDSQDMTTYYFSEKRIRNKVSGVLLHWTKTQY